MFKVMQMLNETDVASFLNELKNGNMEEMEKSIEEFFNSRLNLFRSDIKESESSFIVECELPGFSKENIKINMENDILSIEAEYNLIEENKTVKYIKKERRLGKYSRKFAFEGINGENIKAKYLNGILYVELPKTKKDEVKKEIVIE